MKLTPGNILINADDERMFYIIGNHYRYKRKYASGVTPNFYDGSPGDPERNLDRMEYLAYSSASGTMQWTDFKAKLLMRMRLATEEEMRLIRILANDQII